MITTYKHGIKTPRHAGTTIKTRLLFFRYFHFAFHAIYFLLVTAVVVVKQCQRSENEYSNRTDDLKISTRIESPFILFAFVFMQTGVG